MKKTTVLARDIKVGNLITPESYGLSEECSPVKVTSIDPYRSSFSSIFISGRWEWKGKTFNSEGCDWTPYPAKPFCKFKEVLRVD